MDLRHRRQRSGTWTRRRRSASAATGLARLPAAMSISPHVKALRAKVGSMRLHLPSVAALVFDDAGALLLVRIADGGVWTTPGGVVELDETPADAVVRETLE